MTFLALLDGIPSHDTFTRAFARLDRQTFAACLSQWAQAVAALVLEEERAVGEGNAPEVVAIDGTSILRRSLGSGPPAYGQRLGQ